jgi:hypothetical protein
MGTSLLWGGRHCIISIQTLARPAHLFIFRISGSMAALVGRLPEAVSRWASCGADLRQESEAFSSEYERLDQELAETQEAAKSPQSKKR